MISGGSINSPAFGSTTKCPRGVGNSAGLAATEPDVEGRATTMLLLLSPWSLVVRTSAWRFCRMIQSYVAFARRKVNATPCTDHCRCTDTRHTGRVGCGFVGLAVYYFFYLVSVFRGLFSFFCGNTRTLSRAAVVGLRENEEKGCLLVVACVLWRTPASPMRAVMSYV